jgi:DNA-binding beta-propeller fold protein YncE
MDTAERTTPRKSSAVYDGFISYSHAADDMLAPRLQAGLQRFAKPWWKRRALRIFRDESSLSANPHLWSSITEALDQSGWFVLLLSPDAAGSDWVNQEIEYWKEHKDPSRILPVLTDGTFEWTDNDVSGTAVPEQLQGTFSEEPRWVDMRFARDETDLDLKDPRFADAIADIASALRGVPKDELASEEVRQHRRTIRTAWAAAGLVGLLAVAATVLAFQSVDNAREAELQAEIAAQEANRANQESTRAQTEAANAQRQADLAKARELAASSITASEEDAQLALLLAIEAVDSLPAGEAVGPTLETALRTAMAADRLLNRYDRLEVSSPTAIDVSPDGSLVALAVLEHRTLEVLDAETLVPVWSYAEDTRDGFEWVAFSSEGNYLVLSVADERFSLYQSFVPPGEPEGEPDARFIVFEAATGDVVHTQVVEGACGVNVFPGGWREDLGLLGLGFVGCGSDAQFDGTFQFLDTDTWAPVYEADAQDIPHVVFGGEGPLAATLSGRQSNEVKSAIVDTSTWEVVRELEASFGAISGDGSLFASDQQNTVALEEARSGETVDRFSLGTLFAGTPSFSGSPDDFLVVPLIGDETLIFDPRSGAEVSRLQTGPSPGGAALRGGRLYTAGDGIVSVWDQAGLSQGDLDTVPLDLWVNANSIFQAEGTAFAHVADPRSAVPPPWWFYPVDMASGALGDAVEVSDVWELTPIPGNRVLVQRGEETEDGFRVGPLEVIHLDTGEAVEVAGCWMEGLAANRHEPCPDGEPHPSGIIASVGSRNGREVLIFDDLERGDPSETWLSIWDSESLTEVERINLGDIEAFGNQPRWSAITDDYLVLHNRNLASIDVLDRETLEPVTVEGMPADVARLEHDSVGHALWLTTRASTVWFLDLEALSAFQVTRDSVPGTIRGIAAAPDGERVAITSTDGNVRIFSIEGELQHVIPLPNPSDAIWLDDNHLSVGTTYGPWTTITLDPGELGEVARSRLRRPLSATECQFYGIDPCPTLDEMREG